MAYATASDGTRVYYERFGPSGRRTSLPLVLIAGWATNGRLWLSAVERATAAGYETITIDSRGTGRSATPRRPWSTATLAGDVIAVMDDAGVARAHVAAPSLGGMVAQEFALRFPSRVGALVLAATTGGLPRVDFFDPSGLLRMTSAAAHGWKGDDHAAAVRRTLRATVSEEFARRATATDPPSTRGNLYGLLAAATHSSWSRLHRLRMPVQIQHGTADRLISVRAAQALESHIPGAELRLLPGAGHALILECPDATMDLGLSFLDRHAAPSAPRFRRAATRRPRPPTQAPTDRR